MCTWSACGRSETKLGLEGHVGVSLPGRGVGVNKAEEAGILSMLQTSVCGQGQEPELEQKKRAFELSFQII